MYYRVRLKDLNPSPTQINESFKTSNHIYKDHDVSSTLIMQQQSKAQVAESKSTHFNFGSHVTTAKPQRV
jgi:hypothetical protein